MSRRRTLSLIAAAAGGLCFQLGCPISGGWNFIANLNPCGTVLNCDPVTYEFIRSGYRGPGADPGVDLACTYPPYCPDDPFVSSTPTGE